jgi:hypothetical protein
LPEIRLPLNFRSWISHRRILDLIGVHTVELTKYNWREATISSAPEIDQWAVLFLFAEAYEPKRLRELSAGIEFEQAITRAEWSAIRNGRSEVFWTILSGADFGTLQSGWYWSNDVGNTRISISP